MPAANVEDLDTKKVSSSSKDPESPSFHLGMAALPLEIRLANPTDHRAKLSLPSRSLPAGANLPLIDQAQVLASSSPSSAHKKTFKCDNKFCRIIGISKTVGRNPLEMEDFSSISIEQLVRRCSASSEIGAWKEFVRRFHRLIATVVLRTASRLGNSSTETVDDLIQETYLKLCKNNFQILRDFDQRHPDAFLGYLKVVTSNVVRDHFKSSHAQKRGTNRVQEFGESFTPTAPEHSAGSPFSMERNVLIQQVQAHLEVCISGPDQQRNHRIFWLYYRAGMSAGAIANLPEIGLSTKGIESLILRMTRELRTSMANSQVESAEGILSPESF